MANEKNATIIRVVRAPTKRKRGLEEIPRGLVTFRFDDTQWKEIARHPGLAHPLPNKARAKIEQKIHDYHKSQQPEPRNAKSTREKLRVAEKTAAKLHKILDEEMDDNLYWTLITTYRDVALLEFGVEEWDAARAHLTSTAKRLEMIQLWFKKAQRRAIGRPRGPKLQMICTRYFIGGLCEIFEEFTRERLSYSGNRGTPAAFVRDICKIANPDLGASSIKAAIKDYISGEYAKLTKRADK